jgi:hypothetical protein
LSRANFKEGRAGENDGWKGCLGSKRARMREVFSFKEACKGAGGEDRESKTSPPRLIIKTGTIERYEWGRSAAVSQAV